MKHFAYSILGYLLFSLNNTAFAQKVWSFDGQEPLLASDGKSLFNLHTIRQIPEFVVGFEGKALRTDGYSTWMDITIEEGFSSLSGWFALESYPTDTAAFIGVKDMQGKSVAVCTDRYGELLLGIGEDGSYSYCPVEARIERFKWLHLLLDLENESLYLNGEKINIVMRPKLLLDKKTFLRAGKDFRNKKVWMYDVTAINGLIDEISISPISCDLQVSKDSIASGLKKIPALAIPETRFAKDFNRPHYHLLPAANWTNETHGLIHYNGKYHIFNQKNASAIFLGQINWGHFSSPDLIHWTEEKPALTPDMAYDKNGIWSGHAVINDDSIPQLIYTAGGNKMGVGIAFPKDTALIEWEKYENNPVIAEKPVGFTRTDMRDQYVWKDGDTWYMIIGFGIEETETSHGALLLYKSTDLKKWNFVHLLFEGNPEVDESGIFWEMPVFKKMGDKYVLLVNRVPHNGVPARCQYWIGDFKNEKFIPDSPIPQNLEVINRLLSPSVVETPEGDVVAIAIIPDEIGGEVTYKQGWAHLYSMPRKWQLKNGKLCQTPHSAMKQLREKYMVYTKRILVSAKPYIVNSNGHQFEVKATFYPGDAKRFGFTLCKNPDNSEYSMIYYDVEKQELVVDQKHSSLRTRIPLKTRKDHYPLDTANPVEIHLFIDGSVVEGFINNEDAFTTRIFPSKENSTQLELFSDGNTTEAAAEVWKLKEAKVKMNF
jgi:beta-fructofuranosidase